MPLLKRRSAEENEHFLEETGLSSMRKKLLCRQSVKSFYISSMLMEEGERSRWIVNEGTFLMMNTFDLLIDHLFFECRYHPWTVRNALNFFVESYSYKDQCGISFTHDMGSHYVFTPKGQSSYEIPYLTDCFSYMTQEQADSAADNCEEHMLAYFDREKKRFPALFDGEGTMAIVPVIEGIIYPVFFGKPEAVSEDGKHGRLIRALKEHIQTVLVPGICLFEDGGFKLSETSDNSWISKIFLCQYIIEKVLHMNMPQIMDKADAAHWSWWMEE